MPRFVIVGNGENRRVGLFQQALSHQRQEPALVLEWSEIIEPGLAAGRLAELRGDVILRIDSIGENDAVERALLRRGFESAREQGAAAISADELARIPVETGRILAPRQAHLGFLAVLAEIEDAIDPTWRVPSPPAAIAELFDKRATSAKWLALGIPVPEAMAPVSEPNELRDRMRELGWRRVFVKVTSQSSAACLAIFSHHDGGEYAITTVEDTGEARYNSRRLTRLSQRDDIDRLLRFLLGEGAHIERAVAKAKAEGGYFDLRVLAIDDVAAFTVMRVSRHPITNLQLGGRRGDVGALKERLGSNWDAIAASARAVQRESGAFHVGVDVLVEPSLSAHRVIEGNAFGDLLPNLERDGLDVYGWQIARLLGQSHD